MIRLTFKIKRNEAKPKIKNKSELNKDIKFSYLDEKPIEIKEEIDQFKEWTFKPKINSHSRRITDPDSTYDDYDLEIYDKESIFKHIERQLIGRHKSEIKNRSKSRGRLMKNSSYYIIRNSSESRSLNEMPILVECSEK